ncbi:hypothetical protein [Thermodesulfovibrio hydrogeniphilus]
MAVEGGSLSIAKDSLIRDIYVEDRTEDISSFSCTKTEGDIEGKHRTEYWQRVVNFSEVNSRFLRK